MVDSPAVEVLMLVCLVAPLAIYFLLLGLVNSQSRPLLISSRADFCRLTLALFPWIVAPMPALARLGLWWLIALEAALAAWGFFALLPAAGQGFVAYNISVERFRAILASCLRDLGWTGDWTGRSWRGPQGALHVTGLHLLRSASVQADAGPGGAPAAWPELEEALERRLAQVRQTPSTSGACLLMLGVGLLTLPLWMVGRHVQDLVDAMAHLFG